MTAAEAATEEAAAEAAAEDAAEAAAEAVAAEADTAADVAVEAAVEVAAKAEAEAAIGPIPYATALEASSPMETKKFRPRLSTNNLSDCAGAGMGKKAKKASEVLRSAQEQPEVP